MGKVGPGLKTTGPAHVYPVVNCSHVVDILSYLTEPQTCGFVAFQTKTLT